MNGEIEYDVWLETYKPRVNHILREKFDSSISDDDVAPYNGRMYETYGEEFEAVKKAGWERIWTLVDTDEGLCISAGRHIVNRLGYFICEVKNEDMSIWTDGE